MAMGIAVKQFRTPKATRFVREETGSGLRDGEEDLIELPTSWSKQAVYARFCFERGSVINTDDRGCITKTTRTDGQWNAGDEKRICDWHTFLIFWDKHYPLVRIAPPSTDICTDCHIFFNREKYKGASDVTTRNTALFHYPTSSTTTTATDELDNELFVEGTANDLQQETTNEFINSDPSVT